VRESAYLRERQRAGVLLAGGRARALLCFSLAPKNLQRQAGVVPEGAGTGGRGGPHFGAVVLDLRGKGDRGVRLEDTGMMREEGQVGGGLREREREGARGAAP